MTLFINWAVKPFSMALLGGLFIGWLFRPYLPADQINSYIAGLILLAAAPCTAMVFVWSNLSDGEPHFTLSQVALNDSSWCSHSRRLSGSFSVSRRSLCPGRRCSSRSFSTSWSRYHRADRSPERVGERR